MFLAGTHALPQESEQILEARHGCQLETSFFVKAESHIGRDNNPIAALRCALLPLENKQTAEQRSNQGLVSCTVIETTTILLPDGQCQVICRYGCL